MTPERFRLLKATLERRQPDLTVLAEEVHKPHNVAALLRTCDAVGALELHAVSRSGSFQRPRTITGGTRGWVPARIHPSVAEAVSHLKSTSFQIVAAHFSDSARDYRAPDYTRPTAFLMGSELMGVSREAARLADLHVIIPMRGLVESLNVSVAAALLLYEAARQREAAGLYSRCRLPPERFNALLFEWCYPRIAARCRARGVPYPSLDPEGQLSHNPLGVQGSTGRGSPGTGSTTAGGGTP